LIEIKSKSRKVNSKSRKIKSRRVGGVTKIKVVCLGREWYGLNEHDERIPTLLSLGQSE